VEQRRGFARKAKLGVDCILDAKENAQSGVFLEMAPWRRLAVASGSSR
jgi:hypothetical protein